MRSMGLLGPSGTIQKISLPGHPSSCWLLCAFLQNCSLEMLIVTLQGRKSYLVLGFLDKEWEQESVIWGGGGSSDSLLASIACEENDKGDILGWWQVVWDSWHVLVTAIWEVEKPRWIWDVGREQDEKTERELLSQAFYLNLLNSWKIIMLNAFCLPVIITWSRLRSVSLSHTHMCFSFLYLNDSITGHIQSLQPAKDFFCRCYFPIHERERFLTVCNFFFPWE